MSYGGGDNPYGGAPPNPYGGAPPNPYGGEPGYAPGPPGPPMDAMGIPPGVPPGGYAPQAGYGQPGGYQPQGGYGSTPSADPALQYLASKFAGNNRFVIKQRVSFIEAIGDTGGCDMCCEKENEYDVFGGNGQEIVHIFEESTFCNRCLCNPAHALRLHVHEGRKEQRKELAIIDRPFKCLAICPAACGPCQQETTMYYVPSSMQTYQGQKFAVDENMFMNLAGKTNQFGHTQQPACGGGFSPSLNINDKDENTIVTATGPTCCFGGVIGKTFCDQEFHLTKPDSEQAVGKIVREKPDEALQAAQSLLTDSDLYTLHLLEQFDNVHTMILVMGVIHLDYLFFETNQDFECSGDQCSVTLCNMYCLGCICPCKLKGGSGGSDGGDGGDFQ